jgi:predicted alpha/beta hydrolase family esterase
MKTQILIIGGGNAFEKHEDYLHYLQTRHMSLDNFRPGMNWKNSLQPVLGDNFDVLIMQMPNNQNARYSEWEIWFKRILQLLDMNQEAIFIGHSMGGIFLMRFLSENTCQVKIRAIFLLATPFITKGAYPLMDFYIDPELPGVESKAGRIFIYHSTDDKIVPVICAHRYKGVLPTAHLHILEGCGHINQKEFPEIIEAIRSLQ